MGDDCFQASDRAADGDVDPMVRQNLTGAGGIQLVVRGTGQAVVLTTAKPVIEVGRAWGNDLVLPTGNVSRRHVRFELEDGAVYAEDLGSSAGTLVDGQKISARTRLGRGAVVSFACYELELIER